MGKRKERQSQTLIHSNSNSNSNSDGGDDEFRSDDLEEDEKSGFFACYLLTSLCPRYKGHTYIGFTVNPRRRIRQHNGEICSGATRTKKKRPWEMVLCIHGFPTNTVALQFEWAWQHPVESLAVRKAAVGFKSLGGLANKIKLAYTMLTLPAWNKLNLTVNFFSTKYTKHYAGCPTLPARMKVHIRSMDELPCYTHGCKDNEDDFSRFENDLSDDEEPEKTGNCNFQTTFEDETFPVLASVDPQNNENYGISISENDFREPRDFETKTFDEKYEHQSCTYGLWDDDDEEEVVKTGGGSCDLNDYKNNVEKAICVSDVENYNVFTTTEDKNDGILRSVNEIEVIDVFTPSPGCSRRKKIRNSGVGCPEIIDLTESPICV